MKNKLFFTGIIGIALIFGLLVAGCNDSSNQYTLTFDTQGGSVILSKIVDAGSSVAKPPDPDKENHTFDGWYTAATGESVVSWPLTINSNTTVYARWNHIQGSIIYTFNGLPQDETPNLTGNLETLSRANGIIILSIPGFPEETSYTWFVDNREDPETGSVLTKQGSAFTPGRHEITVLIKTEDEVHSKTVQFNVVE